jgi:hypothetical protein
MASRVQNAELGTKIYESVAFLIIVVRIVEESKVDDKALAECLHFQFELETKLRFMDFGWNFLTNPSKPADMRIKGDTGEPLLPDRYSFCMSCNCKMKIFQKIKR